jgi:hypothetical protein
MSLGLKAYNSKQPVFSFNSKVMKTNNDKFVNNQPKQPVKQVNEPERDKNTSSGKKPVYIKDMPPIDGARPGII